MSPIYKRASCSLVKVHKSAKMRSRLLLCNLASISVVQVCSQKAGLLSGFLCRALPIHQHQTRHRVPLEKNCLPKTPQKAFAKLSSFLRGRPLSENLFIQKLWRHKLLPEWIGKNKPEPSIVPLNWSSQKVYKARQLSKVRRVYLAVAQNMHPKSPPPPKKKKKGKWKPKTEHKKRKKPYNAVLAPAAFILSHFAALDPDLGRVQPLRAIRHQLF